VVPSTQSYPNYYLIEWRTNTKYDRMLKTAYVKNIDNTDEWRVERVPYNIPGAVLYYCNTRYNDTYQLVTNMSAAPSVGPKYPLLVVDMNYEPMHLDNNGTVLDSRIAGYDAAMTLQPSKPFTISQIDTGASIIEGPWSFPSKPAVTRFDDSKGYYAGLFAGSPCQEGSYCYANEGGSVVIPAFDRYTTRITHYDGTSYPELYGTKLMGSTLGTGNPGDDGVQCGVRIELLKKSSDNQKATLRLNAPAGP
jgi:immune inhibitor A